MKIVFLVSLFLNFLFADSNLKCEEYNSLKQPKKYINCLNKYIEKNDFIATKQLADFYYMGQQPYRNYQKAIEWYLKVENQDSSAQCTIGQIYTLGGYGVEKNCKKGLQLYQELAKQNIWYAQDALGHLYQHGVCVKKDTKKANYLLDKAHKEEMRLYYEGRAKIEKKLTNQRSQ